MIVLVAWVVRKETNPPQWCGKIHCAQCVQTTANVAQVRGIKTLSVAHVDRAKDFGQLRGDDGSGVWGMDSAPDPDVRDFDCLR